jgi:hypothetical protein
MQLENFSRKLGYFSSHEKWDRFIVSLFGEKIGNFGSVYNTGGRSIITSNSFRGDVHDICVTKEIIVGKGNLEDEDRLLLEDLHSLGFNPVKFDIALKLSVKSFFMVSLQHPYTYSMDPQNKQAEFRMRVEFKAETFKKTNLDPHIPWTFEIGKERLVNYDNPFNADRITANEKTFKFSHSVSSSYMENSSIHDKERFEEYIFQEISSSLYRGSLLEMKKQVLELLTLHCEKTS